MDTLLIWVEWGSTKLYGLKWHECSIYAECDQHVLDSDHSDLPKRVAAKIEHLAYMIGVEPYYGDHIQEYKDGMAITNHDDDWESGKSKPQAPAPWKEREIVGPIVDFRKIVRVIRTGWYA